MISLVTPSGGRSAAFALCERWMSRQWLKWDQWIVIDDCEPPTACTMGQEIIRPEPLWKPGDNTQARNMRLALQAARGDMILVIEDDDYYAPDYIMHQADKLQTAKIVGEVPAIYYNVRQRAYRIFPNHDHASLCQTGLLAEALPLLLEAIETGDKFIDLAFWNLAFSRGVKTIRYNSETPLCVGIKGLPGRPGIGCGHSAKMKRGIEDRSWKKLKELISFDAEVYIAMGEL